MFERPPGAPGDTINSAVVIVAESLADYHGIKTAADYFGPITELTEQRGFKVENEPDVVLRRREATGPRRLQQTARPGDYVAKLAGHDREGIYSFVHLRGRKRRRSGEPDREFEFWNACADGA